MLITIDLPDDTVAFLSKARSITTIMNEAAELLGMFSGTFLFKENQDYIRAINCEGAMLEMRDHIAILHSLAKHSIMQASDASKAASDKLSTGKIAKTMAGCWVTTLTVVEFDGGPSRLGIGIGKHPGDSSIDSIVMWDFDHGMWSRKPSEVWSYNLYPFIGCFAIPEGTVQDIESSQMPPKSDQDDKASTEGWLRDLLELHG